MTIPTVLFVVLIVLVLLCVVFIVAYRFGKNRGTAEAIVSSVNAEATYTVEKPVESAVGAANGYEFRLIDDRGNEMMRSTELPEMPRRAFRFKEADSIDRAQHLFADLFKGVVGIQNKTLQVVFKSDIQRGIADGTYKLMETKGGEVLADAVNSTTGAIVGKGRVIEAGKVRQLASGAFQLVSIAVAQSHLADIERSLNDIKSLIEDLRDRQDNVDKAQISGAVDYLREVAQHMRQGRSPDELSSEKSHVIEGVIRDSFTWRNQLEGEVSTLTDRIAKLEDQDRFGTGDTHKELNAQIAKFEPLLKRRGLLLELTCVMNFTVAYLDPKQEKFSRVQPGVAEWSALVETFISTVRRRANDLLTKSLWNSEETLSLRKGQVLNAAGSIGSSDVEQEKKFAHSMQLLDDNLDRLLNNNGDMRIALTFDERGVINSAALG